MNDDFELDKELYHKIANIGRRISKSPMVGGVLYLLTAQFLVCKGSNRAIQGLSRTQILEQIEEFKLKMSRQSLHELVHELADAEVVVLDSRLVTLSETMGAYVQDLWLASEKKRVAEEHRYREHDQDQAPNIE